MQPTLTRGVERRVLPNGLTVLVRPVRATPVVAVTTWVKAGYFHEPDQVAGMAHLFEHMYFKGSERFPGPERIGAEVAALGGVLNAATIYDATYYYFVLPREAFARGVAIQADAVIRPRFDPDELRREAEVVIEESNRKYDNPPAYATEMMFALAFTRHRMRRWRIGDHEVLRNIRRDHLLEFFRSLYCPENLIVSVAGDVTPAEAFEAVEREFGPLPRGVLRKEAGPPEPPQDRFRFREARAPLAQSRWVMGFHTPGWGHPDGEELEVLAALLGAGKSSRLHRRAVGPGRAGSAGAYHYPVEDVGMLVVQASLDGARLGAVEEAIFAELARLRAAPPEALEVETARAQILSGMLLGQEEVLGISQVLASREARSGDYHDLDRYTERLRAVTPEAVGRAAAEYLRPENASLFRYLEAGPRPAEAPPDPGAALRAACASPPAPSPPEPRPAGLLHGDLCGGGGDGPATSVHPLANGATLVVQEFHAVPTAWFGAYFRGGRSEESPGNAGITRLTVSAALRGTARRGMEEMERAIEWLGSGLAPDHDEDFLGLCGSAAAEALAPSLGLLREVVTEPAFPEAGVAKAREVVRAAIRAARDSATAHPYDLFARGFFGASHPYGLPQRGDPEVVDRLGRDDLVAWHRRVFDPARMTLVVVGDVRVAEVVSFAEERFGCLPAGGDGAVPSPVAPTVNGVVEVVEQRVRRQTAFLLGFTGPPLQHPDFFPLSVLQHVLSGMAGRLFAELRGRRSLAYTVSAGVAARPGHGCFYGYLAGEHRKEAEAREAMLAEFERVAREPVNEDEIARAKRYIAGTTRIRLQTNAQRGGELARDLMLGLGLDFVERYLEGVAAVDAQAILRAAMAWLRRDRYAIGVLRGGEDG